MSMLLTKKATTRPDSLSDLSAPHNFEPGSEQKIALLRARASKGMSLFVEGEPGYCKPRDDYQDLEMPDRRVVEGEATLASCSISVQVNQPKKCNSEVKKSQSGGTTRPIRSLSHRQKEAFKRAKTPLESRSIEETAVRPLKAPDPLEIIRTLEQMVESGTAITGAQQMLLHLKAQNEQQLNHASAMTG